MPKIKMATGKEYPCDFMGAASEFVLFVKVDIPLTNVLTVFQDPEETKVMQWVSDNGKVVRTESGFTEFTGFSIMRNGCPVRIRMAKKI